MRSRSFLKRYVQFMITMMVMIAGAIVIVFGDFGNADLSDASASVLSVNDIVNQEKSPIETEVTLAMSKTLSQKYVRKGSQDVVLGTLLLQNNSKNDVGLDTLNFNLEHAEAIESLELLDGENVIVSASMQADMAFLRDVNFMVKAGESRELSLRADLAQEILSGTRIRVSIKDPSAVSVLKASKKMSLNVQNLESPFLTVIGR